MFGGIGIIVVGRVDMVLLVVFGFVVFFVFLWGIGNVVGCKAVFFYLFGMLVWLSLVLLVLLFGLFLFIESGIGDVFIMLDVVVVVSLLFVVIVLMFVGFGVWTVLFVCYLVF